MTKSNVKKKDFTLSYTSRQQSFTEWSQERNTRQETGHWSYCISNGGGQLTDLIFKACLVCCLILLSTVCPVMVPPRVVCVFPWQSSMKYFTGLIVGRFFEDIFCLVPSSQRSLFQVEENTGLYLWLCYDIVNLVIQFNEQCKRTKSHQF